MHTEIRIDWESQFGRVLRHMQLKDSNLYMCIDAENQMFSIYTKWYGHSFHFTDEESTFFKRSASLKWEHLSDILRIHDKRLNSKNVVVYLEGDNYVFESVNQQRVVIPIEEDNIVTTLPKIVTDYKESTNRVVMPPVRVELLKKALATFENNEAVAISTSADNSISNVQSPIVVEAIGIVEYDYQHRMQVRSTLEEKIGVVMPLSVSKHPAVVDHIEKIINKKEGKCPGGSTSSK